MENPNDPQPQADHNLPSEPSGQTFASVLLSTFSYAPLLKQYTLRTLHMTEEELASFEPIIAAAWDRWNHERTLRYANVSSDSGGPSTSYLPPHPPPHGRSQYPSSGAEHHEAESNGEKDHGTEKASRSPPSRSFGAGSIDPALHWESGGTSDIRGERPRVQEKKEENSTSNTPHDRKQNVD